MARSAASLGFSLLLLAVALSAAAAQEGVTCCFYGKCGGCQDGVGPEHWCGASEDQCAQCTSDAPDSWCQSGGGPVADYGPYEDQDVYNVPDLIDTPKNDYVPPPYTGSGMCCYWSDSPDMCGNCKSGATGGEWCAQSEGQCSTCAGVWCPDGGQSPPPPKPPAPSLDYNPPVQQPSPSPSPRPRPGPAPDSPKGWIEGTWTTGYWDCCKPSCSWRNKGYVTQPVKACRPDGSPAGLDEQSICTGGTAGSCVDNQPWVVSPNLSMGFAAAAVGGPHGLKGDENCGQCYELVFTPETHNNGEWGGAHPDLAGKTHVIQVTNIGYDVSGVHSFDLQIPGAGQGAFSQGCRNQFPGYSTGDFDCDNLYGGCFEKAGCARLPKALQPGCNWRYDWYKWFEAGGQTNNPYVRFRRVRCPTALTDITGTIPLDDDQYPTYGA